MSYLIRCSCLLTEDGMARRRIGQKDLIARAEPRSGATLANLVVWSAVFERQRRLVLSAGMLACRGRVQREGEVIHVVGRQLEDLSARLRCVEGRGGGCPAQDTHVPGPQLGRGIRVPTRDFR